MVFQPTNPRRAGAPVHPLMHNDTSQPQRDRKVCLGVCPEASGLHRAAAFAVTAAVKACPIGAGRVIPHCTLRLQGVCSHVSKHLVSTQPTALQPPTSTSPTLPIQYRYTWATRTWAGAQLGTKRVFCCPAFLSCRNRYCTSSHSDWLSQGLPKCLS